MRDPTQKRVLIPVFPHLGKVRLLLILFLGAALLGGLFLGYQTYGPHRLRPAAVFANPVKTQGRAAADPAFSAYAGRDRSVAMGGKVSLDGSESYNPSGKPLQWAWAFRSKPKDSQAIVREPNQEKTSFLADRLGVYVVELKVSRGSGPAVVDQVVVTALPENMSRAQPLASAEVVVTDQVMQTRIEPIGMNLTNLAGGTRLAVNNLILGGGFEPMVRRQLERINRAGIDDKKGAWLEWDGNGGVHGWDSFATGFGNGATVRFYRLVDGKGAALRFSEGLEDARDAAQVVFLGEARVPTENSQLPKGGWLSEGSRKGAKNRVYIDKKISLRRGDYAFFFHKRTAIPRDQIAPRLHQYFKRNLGSFDLAHDATQADLVPHPQPLPPEFADPGESCLRIILQKGVEETLGQYLFHAHDEKDGQWYSQLRPGGHYRISAWMRQEGLGNDGKVSVGFSGDYGEKIRQENPWRVTGQWTQYAFDFVAPDYPVGEGHSGPRLSFQGPGTLYIDNLILFRGDGGHAPMGPTHASLDPFLDAVSTQGPKPAVRFYPLMFSASSVEAMLSMVDGNPSYSGNDGSFSPFVGATLPQCLNWALATGQGPADRAIPFLTFNVNYSEREWKAIVEYLGVPFRAGKDTPENKPYAYRRYLQRGKNGTPYTDEFREIVLEFGNETWHNGAGSYGWDGFSAPGAVQQGGLEYGLFARYFFDQGVAKLPEWAALRLGQKIKLALGGNYEAHVGKSGDDMAYGERAVAQSELARYLGHANYVGPKWETDDAGFKAFSAHGLQETLVGYDTEMRKVVETAAQSRDYLRGAQGIGYDLVAYEGGPSGYWQNKDNPEIDELYGKSLAMGVAALDAWLGSSLQGFKHQSFYAYGGGALWKSHTMPEAGGFRPHTGWLAMKLRNQFAPGKEMLAVHFPQLPTYDRSKHRGGKKAQIIPLLGAYALQDEKALYVFVLSKKLPGVHDGYDFGNGYTKVTLQLPLVKAPSKITMHTLAHLDGSPAKAEENNRKDWDIHIKTREIPKEAYRNPFVLNAATGASQDGIPPAGIYLYVFYR